MSTQWKGVAPSAGNPQTMKTPQTYAGMKGSSSVSASLIGGVVGGFPGQVVGLGLDLAGSYLSSEIQGYVSDKYNQRAEERMDARNRKMLLDQPSLTAAGRRRAGLNPYGDATLPGMTGQSSTDTSPAGNLGKSRELMGLYFQEQLALKQLENDTIVAEATAEEKLANARRLTGQEGRDVEAHSYNMQQLIANVKNTELQNSLLEFDKELRAYTIDNEKALSDAELNFALGEIDLQAAKILETNASADEKRASIEYLNEQTAILALQREIKEKTGLSLAYAEVQKAWNMADNIKADTGLKKLQQGETAAKTKEHLANVGKIKAETKEIPKNAKAARFGIYTKSIVDSVKTLSQEACRWFAALSTGGVSEVASSLIKPSDAPFTASDGLPRDSYGNLIIR